MASYIDDVAGLIEAELQKAGAQQPPRRLLRAYAVLALAKGTSTDLDDIHDAWAAWACEGNPSSPSLVPYADLPSVVRVAGGDAYRDAIHRVVTAALEAGAASRDDVRDRPWQARRRMLLELAAAR